MTIPLIEKTEVHAKVALVAIACANPLLGIYLGIVASILEDSRQAACSDLTHEVNDLTHSHTKKEQTIATERMKKKVGTYRPLQNTRVIL